MRALVLLPLLCACAPVETLHLEVIDVGKVSVHRMDGATLIPKELDDDSIVAESGTLGSELPTGAHTATEATMTLSRADGIHERWSTSVHLAQGELFHLVGGDGVLPELPGHQTIRLAPDAQLEIPIGHALVPHHVRGGAYGYDLAFADATQTPSALPILLRMPRDNVRVAERRVDKSYRTGAIALWPALVLSGLGAGVVALGHQKNAPAAYVVGAGVLGGAGALDVFGIYALATGGRRRPVSLR